MTTRALDVFHIASGDIWAGAEAQVALLAEAQRRRGNRVRVATFSEGDLADRLRSDGIETTAVDERDGAVHVWRRLRALIGQDRPDVLHVHGYKEALLGFTSSIGFDVARVRTLHGVPEHPKGFGGLKMRLYESADRFLGHALRVHWLAVSESLERELERHFRGRVHRVTNSVSVRPASRTAEDLCGELGIDAEAGPILLYAGRLEPIKGPDILLESFAVILAGHPRATLIMAGGGRQESVLRQQVAGSVLRDRVHLVGDRRDIFDLMAMADLFVIPSRGEGMPTVLLEALASGCPVVATAVGAIPEVTRNGTLAELVPSEDPIQLAAACSRLLDDPARRSELAKAGIEEISTRYSSDRAAATTHEIYQAALRESKIEVRERDR